MATFDPELLRCCHDTIANVYRGEVPADGVLIGCDHCVAYLQYEQNHWHYMPADWQSLRQLTYVVSEIRAQAIRELLKVHGVLYEKEKARVLKGES